MAPLTPLTKIISYFPFGSDTLSKTITKIPNNNNLQSDRDIHNDHGIEGLLVVTLAALIVAIFVLFFMARQCYQFQRIVDARNEDMVKAAAKSNVIVASLFPSKVRDRLYADAEQDLDESEDRRRQQRKSKKKKKKSLKRKKSQDSTEMKEKEESAIVKATVAQEKGVECSPGGIQRAGSQRLRSYLDGGMSAMDAKNSAPIADLFPHCKYLRVLMLECSVRFILLLFF